MIVLTLQSAALYPSYSTAQDKTDQRGIGVSSPAPTRDDSKKRARELAKSARYALVIGVDKYSDQRIPLLSGAVNDARMLADSLVKNAGFPSENITILTSDVLDQNLQPTGKNIRRELDKLSSLQSRDAFVIVAFAGHGMEIDGNAYLIPSDVVTMAAEEGSPKEGSIVIEEWDAFQVSNIKSNLQQRIKQFLIIMDACRSEPLFRILSAPHPITPQPTPTATARPSYEELNKGVLTYAILYATASKEVALEDKETKSGYLTTAIIRALSGKAADKKGRVTLSGLTAYVQDTVPQLTKGRQRPFTLVEGFKAERLVVALPIK